MPDRPITGHDAQLYINHVQDHDLQRDTQWLLDVGRFPVGCRVLDIGCGTGALVSALVTDENFARSVIGVELSQPLADFAAKKVVGTNGSVFHDDFLSWTPPYGWQPDTLVMSYFLHHCDNPQEHLERAASILPHGGRLYVVDRIAIDQPSLDTFPRFWDERYRAAHEWSEAMPQLMTFDELVESANRSGFEFVRKQTCPHDKRIGAERFPKTFLEFWRCESERHFPAVMVVSPNHRGVVDEIVQCLDKAELRVSRFQSVIYSDELIRTIYRHCPWREALIRFVGEVCRDRRATALWISGDPTSPDLLYRLGQFKKRYRDRWHNINGPTTANGVRAIILPFHVAEPYESEALASLIEKSGSGC
ncbi:class I SAM-dependent methyltransferase [Schlesneria sp. DSM 10557]|uniref:class I SAM-dependent methyltransferase n=1 Tax=Schlesneria sp. DSM 10557 TaxID=3044399 RepID=UPI0035A1BB4F